MIFFFFILLIALLCAGIGWGIYKYYPQIRRDLFKKKDSSNVVPETPPFQEITEPPTEEPPPEELPETPPEAP